MYLISEIKDKINSISSSVFKDEEINTLLIDSRKLSKPENVLFFAIKGNRLDGHKYINELYKKGVKNFIVEDAIFIKKIPKANILLVKNAIDAIQKLAKLHREKFNIPIIGVTGSNGKTIIKEWIHQLLHSDFNITRSPKSYNSQVGVPLSVWKLNKENNLAIFEAGISEPNEMENLQKIIKPTIGIFTNIGSAHGQNFINNTHKVKEKLKLFINSKLIIYCKDHTEINQSIADFWKHKINDNTEKPMFFSWSKYVDADIRILKKIKKEDSTHLKCKYLNKELNFKIPFTDSSSIENSFHCIALLLYLKYDEKTINKKIEMLKRIEMRLEQKKGLNNCIIINDSYNSDIDSLKIALDFLVQQEQTEKRTVILSDILQSGISGVDLYSSVINMLQNAKINSFIGIGKEIFLYKYLFKKQDSLQNINFYKTTDEFLKYEEENGFENEAILLKGARKYHFEKISAFLEEKAHATVFEVNLSSVIHNLQFFTSQLKPNTKVMAMVKAFAYGSGSYEIAKLLEFHRVDYLAVAYTDEGVALRKAGIKLPIMVLNPEKKSFNTMIRHKLEPEIYSLELLKNYISAMSKIDNKPNLIHINLDTGMNRLGFSEEDIENLVNILAINETLKVASIFSHLAASDDKQFDEFTNEQIKKFEKYYDKIVKHIEYKPLKHIVNSSGILRFKKAHFDMVRLGLGLYGINSEIQKELEPVGTFKSKISQIRKLKKDETIGYGRIGIMPKDGKIAVIAVGYADGLSRRLSNGKGNVFLKGQLAPIIGNICMDMTMINISEIENVKIGDEVEIFGKNIKVSTIAKQTNSISYEILTSVSERVKRVFFVE